MARSENVGRMSVILVIHGGVHEFEQVMDGLVQRNARGVKEGTIPTDIKSAGIIQREEPVWKDGVMMRATRCASAGSLAAWRAGVLRAKGGDVSVGLVSGIPVVVEHMASGIRIVDNPVRSLGWKTRSVPLVGMTDDVDHGRITEYLQVGIDDPKGKPVAEVGDAIARHNARRIQLLGLPRLSDSGIIYKTEGAPELWWDAEEELIRGHDDCEGLAAYRAGELIVDGFDAHVHMRAVPKPSSAMGGGGGNRLFHAIARIDRKGKSPAYDDPSARMGMPVPGWYKDHLAKHRD